MLSDLKTHALTIDQHQPVGNLQLCAQRAERPTHSNVVDQWREQPAELSKMIARKPPDLTEKDFTIWTFERPQYRPTGGRAFQTCGVKQVKSVLDVIPDIKGELRKIFILESSWKDQWSERSLEVDLYNSRERAWKFWEQLEAVVEQPLST